MERERGEVRKDGERGERKGGEDMMEREGEQGEGE